MQSVTITGARGLLGQALTQHLLEAGYAVKHISRTSGSTQVGNHTVPVFAWNYAQEKLDGGALEDGDVLIHLAGASVGESRWTSRVKKEILDSRIESTRFLYHHVQKHNIFLKQYIGASAIGYYGLNSAELPFEETDAPGTDFMAQICVEWEKAHELFQSVSVPVCIPRIGIVLSASGGVFASLSAPVRKVGGIVVGSGKQIIPWIAIQDFCRVLHWMMESPVKDGVYNVTAPEIVTHSQVVKLLAAHFKKPFFPVHVPGFLVRMALGEQAELVLKGSAVSSRKLIQSGFSFEYPEIRTAIRNLQ